MLPSCPDTLFYLCVLAIFFVSMFLLADVLAHNSEPDGDTEAANGPEMARDGKYYELEERLVGIGSREPRSEMRRRGSPTY